MVSLDELLIIKEIAKYGSITHASAQVHISSSSLSRTLQEVEKELGVELFKRNGRHLILNNYGKTLVHHCDIAEQTLSNTFDEIRALKERKEKLIRVYFRHSLGNVSKALAPFIRMNENIQLDIILSGKEALQKGYDLEFVSVKEKLDRENAILLAQEHYVLVANKASKYRTASTVCMADLQEETFIVPPIQQGGKLLENLCKESGFLPKRKIDCPQVWGALHYVEQNMGILIAPELSMLAGFDSEDVTIVPINTPEKKELLGPRFLYILINENYNPTSRAWDFIEYMKGLFSSSVPYK